MESGFAVDQLRGDADRIASLADAAFDDGANPERVRDGARVAIVALIGETRRPGCNVQAGRMREQVDQLFGDTVAEVIEPGIAGQIGEGQDRHCGMRISHLRKGGTFMDQTVSQATHGDELVGVMPQGFAQRGDMDLDSVFLDRHIWPHCGHQFVLGDQVAFGLRQHRQQLERLAPQGNGGFVRQELAVGLQRQVTNAILAFGHGDSSTANTVTPRYVLQSAVSSNYRKIRPAGGAPRVRAVAHRRPLHQAARLRRWVAGARLAG